MYHVDLFVRFNLSTTTLDSDIIKYIIYITYHVDLFVRFKLITTTLDFDI